MANCEGCIHAVVCYKYADACIMKSHSCENYRKDEKRPHGEWIDFQEDGYVECPFCDSMTECDGNKDELHYCFSCGAELS